MSPEGCDQPLGLSGRDCPFVHHQNCHPRMDFLCCHFKYPFSKHTKLFLYKFAVSFRVLFFTTIVSNTKEALALD